MPSPRFFILTKASWRIFVIKGGMSIFYILRVFSMGHDFFSNLDSNIPVFCEQYIDIISPWTMLNPVETLSCCLLTVRAF